jgi:hypothetical protein
MSKKHISEKKKESIKKGKDRMVRYENRKETPDSGSSVNIKTITCWVKTGNGDWTETDCCCLLLQSSLQPHRSDRSRVYHLFFHKRKAKGWIMNRIEYFSCVYTF